MMRWDPGGPASCTCQRPGGGMSERLIRAGQEDGHASEALYKEGKLSVNEIARISTSAKRRSTATCGIGKSRPARFYCAANMAHRARDARATRSTRVCSNRLLGGARPSPPERRLGRGANFFFIAISGHYGDDRKTPLSRRIGIILLGWSLFQREGAPWIS